MSFTLRLPDDPREYQQFLEDLLRSYDELRQQAEIAQQQTKTAQQQAVDAERRVEELERVLDQTAADYDKLKEQHAELAETLALFRRYIYGQRRERFIDAPGQGHLFDIPEILDEPEPACAPLVRRHASEAVVVDPLASANPAGSPHAHPHPARCARV